MLQSPLPLTRRRAVRRAAGFSFIEILVVMGIIAVLAGLGILVINIWRKRGPEKETQALLMKLKASTDSWKQRFRDYPPVSVLDLPKVTEMPPKVALKNLPNQENNGIEALYQALFWPGFGQDVEVAEKEFGNLDEDSLPQAITSRGPALSEFKDAWGSALVYFHNTSYVRSEQSPPGVTSGRGEVTYPKPWREAGGGFVNPNGFQIFSLGPDFEPNTDDDVCTWR